MSVHLSVVVPAYNESRMIFETLRRLKAYLSLKEWAWEVIISNDGSKDNTSSIVRSIIETTNDFKIKLIDLPRNQGKGAAVKAGVLRAEGEFILISDADLSAPIKEVEKLLAALETEADVATATRAIRVPGADVQQSFKRFIAGRIFNQLVRILTKLPMTDTQCGFKCFKREAAKKIFEKLTLERFGFDVEALLLAKQEGYRIKEVPVMWKEGRESKVNLVKDSLAMIGELIYLRKKYL